MPRTLTRRRSSQATVEPEETEDESSTEETDEEETPRARRGARRGSVPAPRDSDDNDDDDEAPTTRRARAFEKGAGEGKAKSKPLVGKGWAAVEKEKAENSDFAQNFKVSEEETIIKFLDGEPFAVYRQHWIEKPGKKSYACLSSLGDDCPLCDDMGDKPRALNCFNVIDFTDPDDPQLKVWEAGSRVTTTLQNYASKDKTKPLNRDDLYFAISRSGKGTKSVTSVQPVKVRDLEEDYDIEPLDTDALADFKSKVYDETSIYFNTAQQLEEVVEEVQG